MVITFPANLCWDTFNATIIKIIKEGEKNFEIMLAKGDKFLGGEDIDNKIFLKKWKSQK